MTKREFAKWTQTRTREVAKSVRYGCTVAKNGTTVCVDTLTGKVGIARLHPDDNYVFETGVAIAYARCKGIEIPKVSTYKKLSEMKNGENFVDMFGDTFRYVAKDKDVFVVWNYDFKKYSVMLCDVEYEMVD
jgi:hypothetical protein